MNRSANQDRTKTIAIASAFSIGFYGAVWAGSFVPALNFATAPAERYFAGHPIAITATIMFFIALAMLIVKSQGTTAASGQLETIRDEDLAPESQDGDGSASGKTSAGDRWLSENDAGYVARGWLDSIEQLPGSVRSSLLVSRLSETLSRQADRGGSAELADDLREMADRDADAAHDSLGLVRIIVWAIPMLGFLGTVIGITQTLGGLDFTNGTAAVDSLKTGLNIAFDTTALGLVLSVVAIFLQHPVERRESAMLAEVDHRVGRLVARHLPSADASDNQTVLIADLCRGVQTAVSQSLDDQARLWRETIDETRSQWQTNHQLNNQAFIDAFEVSLIPALKSHAVSVAQHTTSVTNSQQEQENVSHRLAESVEALSSRLVEHHDAIEDQPTITDAMQILARAVDHLTKHLASEAPASAKDKATPKDKTMSASSTVVGRRAA